MTKSAKPDYSKIDVHQLLQRRRQIAIIWSVEDVQEVRPDLDATQAWTVLQQCERVHDCSVGFTWELLQYVADDLFPLPPTREE